MNLRGFAYSQIDMIRTYVAIVALTMGRLATPLAQIDAEGGGGGKRHRRKRQ